jgi:tRNA(fMet)-specific endonuclease VapC
MLDTNTVSYIIKGNSLAARQKFEAAGEEDEVCISAITEAEVRYGLAKRPMNAVVREQIELFLDTIDVQPWDSEAAKEYGRMRANLEASGRPLANMDLLIAAHASSIGAVLVTNDKAFANVDSAVTVNWTIDVS